MRIHQGRVRTENFSECLLDDGAPNVSTVFRWLEALGAQQLPRLAVARHEGVDDDVTPDAAVAQFDAEEAARRVGDGASAEGGEDEGRSLGIRC